MLFFYFIVAAPPAPIGIGPNARWNQKGVTVVGSTQGYDELRQLNYPTGLYVDDDQTVYVADCHSHRIVAWKYGESDGQVIAGVTKQVSLPRDIVVDTQSNSLIICNDRGREVMRWPLRNGTSGHTIISDIDCRGLAMDNDGSLYVSDYMKGEVRRWRTGEKSGKVVAGGHGAGARLDQLNYPEYIFVDRDYSVYVSDRGNDRVVKWQRDATAGVVVAGGHGSGDALNQLDVPRGVVVDSMSTVYVADSLNHRIMSWAEGATHGRVVVGGNGEGAQANQLSYPMGISFDQHGNLYVVDRGNDRVQRFSIDRRS